MGDPALISLAYGDTTRSVSAPRGVTWARLGASRSGSTSLGDSSPHSPPLGTPSSASPPSGTPPSTSPPSGTPPSTSPALMPLADVASSLRTLLSRPTAGAPLADLARGARRVGVVVPDRTRSAGLDELLPTVVAAVGEASPGAGVTVIVGGGTHAGDDPGAWTRRLPDGVSLVVHDARDDASLRSLGTTGRGTPVALAAAAVDADLLVVLGGIGFHYFAGYSGGRKGIFPGLGGYEAIRRNHALVLVGDPGRGLHPACRPGNLLGNPVHLDALEAARLVGPEVFLINVALDARGRVEDLVTGDLAVAHAAGAARYGARHTATLDAPVDLVLADGGGHPGDLDLVQTHKSLRHAAPAVRDGGALVLLARCEEGVGSATMARWFDHPTADEIEDALRADYTLNSHTALSVRRITERVRLHLVSELDPALVRRMGAVPHADPETAVRAARDEVGASASGLVLRSPATVRIESPSSPA